jgi:hypothetical protein
MTKFLDKKMTFAAPRVKREPKKTCGHSTFGRILKAGKWYSLPCMCPMEK